MFESINNINVDFSNVKTAEPSFILKGAPVASAISEDLQNRAKSLKEKGVVPCLAILMVGDKAEDASYKAGLLKRCDKCGIAVKEVNLPAESSETEILDTLDSLNKNGAVHGILVFRPLQNKKTEEACGLLINPDKDVDCMSFRSLAHVFTGMGEGFAPCTTQAVMEILNFYNIDLEGRNVAIVGRSNVIGKPLAMLMQQKNATVTMCHTKTVGLSSICSRADIVIAACGKAKMLGANYFSEGQIVIDVGINVGQDGKLCGDVDFEQASGIASAITPVPGGVGAVTSSVMAKHVIMAAEKTLK